MNLFPRPAAGTPTFRWKPQERIVESWKTELDAPDYADKVFFDYERRRKGSHVHYTGFLSVCSGWLRSTWEQPGEWAHVREFSVTASSEAELYRLAEDLL